MLLQTDTASLAGQLRVPARVMKLRCFTPDK
jgi:hypothetical protein